MHEDTQRILLEFLSEHWSAWESHCDNHGEDGQILFEELGGEPE